MKKETKYFVTWCMFLFILLYLYAAYLQRSEERLDKLAASMDASTRKLGLLVVDAREPSDSRTDDEDSELTVVADD